jgi:LuxR family quorum sensing-dependent transcriptional regulator
MQATTSLLSVAMIPVAPYSDLQARLTDYVNRIGAFDTPSDVLDGLHAVTNKSPPLRVLGAARFPINDADWRSLRPGRSVFLHKDVPKGWWEEYDVLARGKFRPALFLAKSSLASYTWTEISRLFEPIGVDRWCFELALKYGMRDGLTCPVGGRWVVAFWSHKVLGRVLTTFHRLLILAAANFTALRLEQMAGIDATRIRSPTRLTARELAVLRLVSTGTPTNKIAEALCLGEETIRSHLKKAQAKLGACNRTHAACEAVRQALIP